MNKPKNSPFPPEEELRGMKPDKLRALVTKVTGIPIDGTRNGFDAVTSTRRVALHEARRDTRQALSPEEELLRQK